MIYRIENKKYYYICIHKIIPNTFIVDQNRFELFYSGNFNFKLDNKPSLWKSNIKSLNYKFMLSEDLSTLAIKNYNKNCTDYKDTKIYLMSGNSFGDEAFLAFKSESNMYKLDFDFSGKCTIDSAKLQGYNKYVIHKEPIILKRRYYIDKL